MDGESQIDTPARGASPTRKTGLEWLDERDTGRKHHLYSVLYDHDAQEVVIDTTFSEADGVDMMITPKWANRIVRALDDRAVHLALLRRALDACYGDTWQTCNPNHLADWAQEIRAALAGADR